MGHHPMPASDMDMDVFNLQQQHQHYQLVMLQQQLLLQQQEQPKGNMLTVADPTGQRHLMRSPVSFREGRRASDGLVAQAGFVAFQQRLYDKGKAHGCIELHDVQQEHKALQNQFGGSGSNSSSRSGTPDGGAASASEAKGQGQPSGQLRPSISKRISVPENFTYFPTASAASSQPLDKSGLQQQLMHQRIYQKRQNLPKPTLMMSASARRNLLTRQAKSALKPYLPQDFSASMCGHVSNDFLFQPIAEDESDSPPGAEDKDKATPMVLLAVPTCVSMPSSPTPASTGIRVMPMSKTPPVILMEEDMDEVMSIDLTSAQATLTTTSLVFKEGQSDPYWQTLPSHMAESCRLEAVEAITGSPRRINPPNKLDVTKVTPSSPRRSPILQTGSSHIGPPPLKATPPEATEVRMVTATNSPESAMDISPK